MSDLACRGLQITALLRTFPRPKHLLYVFSYPQSGRSARRPLPGRHHGRLLEGRSDRPSVDHGSQGSGRAGAVRCLHGHRLARGRPLHAGRRPARLRRHQVPIKFRSRPGDENKPAIIEEGHGNPLIEIGLITASIGALVIIAIPTLSAIWYTDDVPAESVPTSKLAAWYPRVEGGRENYAKSVEEQVLEVDVIGKQWWFRFEYPQLGLTNDAKHSVPNELVIPKGKAVRINLRSEDVIHSFWVPKIAGKVDLMPGRKNHMWIQADQTGHYYGQCAEFCGDS
ncbi:MAG: hypothetical protein EBR95_05980, partial [Verrucomicrobia bacterium]|nr:hypothetical protein [Verrucomicrobiota bacterium]